MSEDARKGLSRLPAPDSYAVGYGRPPAHTRFAKGRSGNPKGRPRGSKNQPNRPALSEERLKTIILDEAYRTVSVNDPQGPVTIPMAQAVIRSLAVNAAKGSQRAQRLFTQLLSATERENRRLHDAHLDAAITYKVAWERELARRANLGVTGPEPLPHPDHVVIDLQTGSVRLTGPATREEQRQLQAWRQYKDIFEQELEDLRALLEDPKYPDREDLAREIAKTEQVLEIVATVLRIGRVPTSFPTLDLLQADDAE